MPTCGDDDYPVCPLPGLAFRSCCHTNKTCIPLAGFTTVLCCDEGVNCNRIKSIPCNLDFQDSTKDPPPEVQTSVRNGTLPVCGAACCPWGYSCDDVGNCLQDAHQVEAPRPSTMTSSPTESATLPTAGTEDDQPPGQPLNRSEIIGLAIGGAVGLFVIIGIIYLIYHIRKSSNSAATRPVAHGRGETLEDKEVVGQGPQSPAEVHAYGTAPPVHELENRPVFEVA